MVRRRVDPDVVSSWSSGRLQFRATPLREALDEVNRYASTPIRIIDPALNSIPISGTFDLGDAASVASALEALLHLQAAQKDGEILLRASD